MALAQTASPKPVQVVFETELGNITLEVDLARAPVTAANFLKYVDGKFYDNGVVNRAVRPDNTTRKDVEIQVIQFQIDPARRRAQFPPIPLERTNVTGLKHVDGAISMARAGPDTATGSFSIVINDQPEMDFGGKRNADGQGFAVFGRVVAGMDVVKKIQASKTRAADAPGRGAYSTETLDPPDQSAQSIQKIAKTHHEVLRIRSAARGRLGTAGPTTRVPRSRAAAGADQKSSVGGQAERQQSDGAQIEAPRRDVGLADAGLMAAEADAQPAVRIEGVGRFDRPANDGSERAAHLRGRDAVWQRAAQRHLRQRLKRAEAVGDRSAEGGKRPIGRDEALQDRRVATRTRLDARAPAPSRPLIRSGRRRARRAASAG